MVQLDYDEDLAPLHGMYGSMEAELEVQRTIKRTELTAFLCLLKKVIGPIQVHVDNKGIIDGLWRGEKKCVDPKAGDADLWRNMLGRIAPANLKKKCWRNSSTSRCIAQKRIRKRCRFFEKFVTEGNENADELAKTRAMSAERFMAEARAKTMQQEREVRSQLSLFGGRMERL